jgi:hypothetical protein
MTATEQLAIWAAAPNDEIFVWMQYPKSDQTFLGVSFGDEPSELGRLRAGDVLAAFQRTAGGSSRIASDVLARFQNITATAKTTRVDEINGVACVILEGKSPVSPHSPYRVLLSSVASFT